MNKDQVFKEVVNMMSEHNWLHNAIERKWIELTEKDIFEYFSKTIGGQLQEGGTFLNPGVGFYRTNKKGVEVTLDTKKTYFYSWKAITSAVIETRFSCYYQLSLF